MFLERSFQNIIWATIKIMAAQTFTDLSTKYKMSEDIAKELENAKVEIDKWCAVFGGYDLECMADIENEDCFGKEYAATAIQTWPETDCCPSCHKKQLENVIEPNHYDVYTDGSCLGNIAKNNPPAGWAFIIVDSIENKEIFRNNGTVITCREDDNFVGAEKMSNNTAELSAIYHALYFISKNAEKNDRFTIKYDSEYAAKSVSGEFNGSKNTELINNCRKLLKSIKNEINWQFVKAHNGDEYNELTDKLAKEAAKRCYAIDHPKPNKRTIFIKEQLPVKKFKK